MEQGRQQDQQQQHHHHRPLLLLSKAKNYLLSHYSSLPKDFHRPDFEFFASELEFLLGEIAYLEKILPLWEEEQEVPTPLLHAPASSSIKRVPWGKCLLISPWNYPLQLSLSPLLTALLTGNQVTLRPSEHAPKTAEFLKKMCLECFPEVEVITGGDYTTTQALLEKEWDFIFFTGSTRVGKLVMKAASENLTPVLLELGGKSPCVIWKNDPFKAKTIAQRLLWGKFFNAGQTCVAPDYLIVEKNYWNFLAPALQATLKEFFPENLPLKENMASIASLSHFERLEKMLPHSSHTLLVEGLRKKEELMFGPTLILVSDVKNSPLFKEEIFGPILPIVLVEEKKEIYELISEHPNPLASYLFSQEKSFIEEFKKTVKTGGLCIRDTLIPVSNPYLPFGGVRQSGMGHYHGKYSLETFTRPFPVMERSYWPEHSLRYPPYKKKWPWIKALMRLFGH